MKTQSSRHFVHLGSLNSDGIAGRTRKRQLRVGIVDLLSRGSSNSFYDRIINANFATIMPQVIGVWCREEGHQVSYICYTGNENLLTELPDGLDLVFINAYTETAHTAYALSNFCRQKGIVTALGGPHARCYPEDAQRHFDFVFGFTDKECVRGVLQDCSPHRPSGIYVSAAQQPKSLPGVRARWEFIEPTLKKTPVLKVIPMIGSMGCPYSCNFCIDASVPYQMLDFDLIKEDLKFLRTKVRSPKVAWHDPNFGVCFDAYMDAIEEAVPPGSVQFLAESSLSLLSEAHLRRLRTNGFKVLFIGIESWFELGDKSRAHGRKGIEKVRQISEHINLIFRYVPYVQTNFLLGLDSDDGSEPFELTKRFMDMTPASFPAYSHLTSFGRAAPQNLEYQRTGRIIGLPFRFLDSHHTNIRPKNYPWRKLYDHVIDLMDYTFSPRMTFWRAWATQGSMGRFLNILRSGEGFRRTKYLRQVRSAMDTDTQVVSYLEQETDKIPDFYRRLVLNDLGILHDWLPEGALEHDPYAYLKAEQANAAASAIAKPVDQFPCLPVGSLPLRSPELPA